ncbi:MAG: hypothetical protein ACM3VS_09945 [Candidatus Dadabacteria bacterium]
MELTTVSRSIVLDTLIKHETLTIADLVKKENLGVVPNRVHLKYLLMELVESGCIKKLNGITPYTYTITPKGIAEGARLKATN